MKPITFIIGVAVSAWIPCAGSADVTGVVTINGEPPVKFIAAISADPACGMLHRGPVPTEDWVVGNGHGLANVVVYLEISADDGAVAKPPQDPVLIDQANCMFRPHVVAAVRGQEVKILNRDGFRHSSQIDLGGTAAVRFVQQRDRLGHRLPVPEHAGMFELRSDSHPWMNAWIDYFDHPYFAVTDENGHFRIDGAPPDGDYKIIARHELGQRQEERIVIKNGSASAHFEFTVPSKQPAASPSTVPTTGPTTETK